VAGAVPQAPQGGGRAVRRLIAEEIITPSKIIATVLSGPLSDRSSRWLQHHVQHLLDSQAGLVKPVLVFAVGTDRYRDMKQMAVEKIMSDCRRR